MTDLRQIVGTHEPDEAGPREAALQLAKGVGGIMCAKLRFEVEHLDAPVVGELRRGVETPLERGHAAHRFERVLRRDQPPHLVEVEPLQRLEADMAVAGMGRVEGAAEQADPLPRQRPQAYARSGQGRTRGIGGEGRRRITRPAWGARAVARAGEQFNERSRLST